MTTTFDFGDGNGPVLAHRHINPDGSEGGWVADTARVDATVYVSPGALIGGNARVTGYARVMDNAEIGENAQIGGDACVEDNAQIWGHACVEGKAQIGGRARVDGYARVGGEAQIWDDACVGGKARVGGNACIWENACVGGNARVEGNAQIGGVAWIGENARVEGGDFIYLGPLGPEGHGATITLKPDLIIHIGGFTGGLGTFREYVNHRYGDSHYAERCRAMADFAEAWAFHQPGMQAGKGETAFRLKD